MCFYVVMNEKTWPKVGSSHLVKEIDDHADIIEVIVPTDPMKWTTNKLFSMCGGKTENTNLNSDLSSNQAMGIENPRAGDQKSSIRLSRFWNLDDDGVYMITLNTIMPEKLGQDAHDRQAVCLDAIITIAPRGDAANFEYELSESMVTVICHAAYPKKEDKDRLGFSQYWNEHAMGQFVDTFLIDHLLGLKHVVQDQQFGWNESTHSANVVLGTTKMDPNVAKMGCDTSRPPLGNAGQSVEKKEIDENLMALLEYSAQVPNKDFGLDGERSHFQKFQQGDSMVAEIRSDDEHLGFPRFRRNRSAGVTKTQPGLESLLSSSTNLVEATKVRTDEAKSGDDDTNVNKNSADFGKTNQLLSVSNNSNNIFSEGKDRDKAKLTAEHPSLIEEVSHSSSDSNGTLPLETHKLTEDRMLPSSPAVVRHQSSDRSMPDSPRLDKNVEENTNPTKLSSSNKKVSRIASMLNWYRGNNKSSNNPNTSGCDATIGAISSDSSPAKVNPGITTDGAVDVQNSPRSNHNSIDSNLDLSLKSENGGWASSQQEQEQEQEQERVQRASPGGGHAVGIAAGNDHTARTKRTVVSAKQRRESANEIMFLRNQIGMKEYELQRFLKNLRKMKLVKGDIDHSESVTIIDGNPSILSSSDITGNGRDALGSAQQAPASPGNLKYTKNTLIPRELHVMQRQQQDMQLKIKEMKAQYFSLTGDSYDEVSSKSRRLRFRVRPFRKFKSSTEVASSNNVTSAVTDAKGDNGKSSKVLHSCVVNPLRSCAKINLLGQGPSHWQYCTSLEVSDITDRTEIWVSYY